MEGKVVSIESILENVPLVLGIILKNLDGVSTLNLANTSANIRLTIRNYLSGNTGTKYWISQCKRWYVDPYMLKVIASYDTIVERRKLSIEEITEKEKDLRFSWVDAYSAAHDVIASIRCGQIKLVHLKTLQDQIKGDICIKYGHGFKLHYDVPNRVTGTSGSLAWNIICPAASEENPHTVFIYENMTKCKRILDGGQSQVHGAQLMTVIRPASQDKLQEAVHSSKYPIVSRFLLTVSDDSVCIIPVQEGTFLKIDFPKYPFDSIDEGVYMIPKVATFKNYFAVWSDPSSLRVYSVAVADIGTVNATLCANIQQSAELGRLWFRWSQLDENCEYVFNLMVNENGYTNNVSGGDFLVISIACPTNPHQTMCRIRIPERMNNIQHYELTEHSLHLHYIAEASHEKLLSLNGNKSAHGLHIYWNSEFLVASRNCVQWFFQDWMACELTNDNDPDSFDVSLIEIIAPNVLALVSGENIYIVLINLNKGESTDISLLVPIITVEPLRKINTGFFERGFAIRQLGFDYDQGAPYIWVVVDKVCHPCDESSYKIKDKPWSFEFYRIEFENN